MIDGQVPRLRLAAAIALLATAAACENPRPPTPCGSIPEQTVLVGESATVSACFDDPNEETLVFSTSTSGPGVATVNGSGNTITVTAVSPGTAQITITATDPGGLTAQQGFRVVVPNRAPAAVGTIGGRELMVGDSSTLDVSDYFSEPDGQPLSFSASSSDTTRLTATLAEAELTIVAVAKGTVSVTVTAADPNGLTAAQSFQVAIPNRHPQPVDSIAPLIIEVGRKDTVALAVYFTDPDDDPLSYSIAVSDSSVVSAPLSQDTLSVTALRTGTATVTITASDGEGGSAVQSLQVTVPNRAPLAAGTIRDRVLVTDDTFDVRLGRYFTDPDGHSLAYKAVTSDSTVVTAELQPAGEVLVVTAVGQGEAHVIVTATDPEGLAANQSFRVFVANRGPAVTETIGAQTLFRGDRLQFDLALYFGDPDRDTLEYDASTANARVVTVEVAAGTLVVRAVAQGEARVTVGATDPGGLRVAQRFRVAVPNRAPISVGSIPSLIVEVDSSRSLVLSPYFADPDRDSLSFSVEVSDSRVVRASVMGDSLTLTALAKGEAVVTVRALDPRRLSATSSLRVTVPNRAPVLLDSIPAQVLFKDDTTTLALAPYFDDPDGDTLAYAAQTSDSSVVTAAVSAEDGTLTLTALQQGEAVVYVTSTDTEALEARQSFRVSVPNREPVVTDSIRSQALTLSQSVSFDLSTYFSDPDLDELNYHAIATDSSVIAVEVSGAALVVTAVGKGEAEVTVMATDSHGLSARLSFTVAVLNRAPTIAAPLPTLTTTASKRDTLELSLYFSDPDGDTLSYTAETSDRRVVRATLTGSRLIIRAVAKGTAEVAIVAADPDSLTVEQSFTVIVVNQAPVVRRSFPELTISVGERITLPIPNYFRDPDRDALTYAAGTSDADIATASVSGTSLTLRGVSEGLTTLTLTATDPDGLAATQSARLMVEGQAGGAPTALGTIPEQTMAQGASRRLDVSGYFVDPNGDPLRFTATSAENGVVRASVSGARMTLSAVVQGQTTVTVTATDPGDLSTIQTTLVTVVAPREGPVAIGSIPDQGVEVGQDATITATDYFQDPDDGSMDFTAASSDPGIVTASASANTVTLTGRAEGQANVTITATDSDRLSAAHTVAVTVAARGQAPVPVGSIPTLAIDAGDLDVFDASAYFRDPEGGDLSYQAGTADATVATASASGAAITVRGVAPGKTTLTVTATDQTALNATQSADVEISTPPRGPDAVGAVPDQSIEAGDEIEIDMAPYFSDPNGNPLTYTAGTSSRGIATVEVIGSRVQAKGRGRGTATITVVASDPQGRSAVQSFRVTVRRIDTGFDIKLGFASVVSAGTEAAVRIAAATWESALSRTEFGDFTFDDIVECHISGYNVDIDAGQVDDLAIAVIEAGIDGAGGTVGVAGLCYIRASDEQPILSVIAFDAADVGRLQSSGTLLEVALHEIAHALGFGLSDPWDGWIGDPSGDEHFAGPQAVAAFNSAGGSSYTGGKVPTEGIAHWRESVLEEELMTPTVSIGAPNPMSAITLQALADMGYTVNAGFAEPYSLPSPDIAGDIVDDVPTINLRNDVEQGPIIVIDSEGNVRRVVPGDRGPETRVRPGAAAARADSTIRVIFGDRR